jgi:Fe-S-cluster containining protein
MKCFPECGGACCESMSLPVSDVRTPTQDSFEWLLLHGHASSFDNHITFECKCTALDEAGACRIYENRPKVCVNMQPGGAECLTHVRERRTAAQYKTIRDDDDPLTIHEVTH